MQSDLGPSSTGILPTRGSPSVAPASEQPLLCIEVHEKDAAASAEFNRVLTDIASRLSNVVDGQFDAVVTGCLRTLVELLGFDRSTLMAFSEHGRCFQVTHSWAVDGAPGVPSEVLSTAQFPWFTQQIRNGHIVSVSGSIDLPTVAAKERAYLRQSGVKSALVLPLLMEGAIVGAVSFASLASERRWPLGLVSRLRLTGEILALGIRRHQYAQGLQAIAQTMDEVSPDHAAPGVKVAGHFRDRAMRLMQAEHQERRRMGLVLHEDVMQILSAASIFVQSHTNGTSSSPAIEKALGLLKEATQKLRQLTLELRPEAFFEMTFADGVRWLVGQMRRRYDLDVDISVADPANPVSDSVRNFLYDSARKLLENVANHASCSQASLEITLSDPDYIHLTVSDEGVGFNPACLQEFPVAAFGLFSIREQAELLGGTLEVTSSPGQGTRVVLTVPLSD